MIIKNNSQIDNKKILICTSVGGSPIHEGHTRLILDCKPKVLKHLNSHGNKTVTIGNLALLVIVNSDSFLKSKHGFCFQSEDSRAEILDSIKTSDYTYIHYSDTQFVDGAIRYFQPHYFCKGGDRSSLESLPRCEIEACEVYGTKILFGVGGTEKASSSSDLIKRAVAHYSIELQEKYNKVCSLNSELNIKNIDLVLEKEGLEKELSSYHDEYDRLAQRFDDMQKENEFEQF